jgi:hypothetical protein
MGEEAVLLWGLVDVEYDCRSQVECRVIVGGSMGRDTSGVEVVRYAAPELPEGTTHRSVRCLSDAVMMMSNVIPRSVE